MDDRISINLLMEVGQQADAVSITEEVPLLRVDDVQGPLWWVPIANEVGLKPWIGPFIGSVSPSSAIAFCAQAACSADSVIPMVLTPWRAA